MAVDAFLAFDGDSMFARSDGGGSTTPALVLASMGNPGGNFATSGHTLTEVQAGIATVDAAWAGRYEFVYIIWAGTNDIFDAITLDGGAGSGAAAAVRMGNLVAQQAAKNQRVVVVTCLNSSLSPAHEPQRLILNAAIRSDWTAWGADAIVDLDLVTALTPAGSTANPTYFYDQTHLLPVGRALVATAISDILNGLSPAIT